MKKCRNEEMQKCGNAEMPKCGKKSNARNAEMT
jgi:hypothetical protein